MYAQKLLHHIRYFDDICCTSISGQGDVLGAKSVAPPCYPFDISPLNDIANQDVVSYAKMIALFCFVLELSPMSKIDF